MRYSQCMLPRDLVAASSRPLILSILAQEESYGYAILQRIRQLSDQQIEWNEGMLYPVLHRLESEGLIRAEWKQAQGARERKYYTLSQDGRLALKTEQARWLAVHNTLCKLWQIKPVSI